MDWYEARVSASSYIAMHSVYVSWFTNEDHSPASQRLDESEVSAAGCEESCKCHVIVGDVNRRLRLSLVPAETTSVASGLSISVATKCGRSKHKMNVCNHSDM